MRYGHVVGDGDAEILKDPPNLVGIWCHASTYAHRHGLKGFFSGMFISEMSEAYVCGVEATGDEVDFCASDFALRFGDMLRAGMSVREAAEELMDPRYITDDLTAYNYSRLQYRADGEDEEVPLDMRDDGWVLG